MLSTKGPRMSSPDCQVHSRSKLHEKQLDCPAHPRMLDIRLVLRLFAESPRSIHLMHFFTLQGRPMLWLSVVDARNVVEVCQQQFRIPSDIYLISYGIISTKKRPKISYMCATHCNIGNKLTICLILFVEYIPDGHLTFECRNTLELRKTNGGALGPGGAAKGSEVKNFIFCNILSKRIYTCFAVYRDIRPSSRRSTRFRAPPVNLVMMFF